MLPPHLTMKFDLSGKDEKPNRLYECCYIFSSGECFSKQIAFSASAKIGEPCDVLFIHVDVIFKKLKIFFFTFSLFLFAFFKSFAHKIECSVPSLKYRRNFGNQTRIEKVITKSRISVKTFGTYFKFVVFISPCLNIDVKYGGMHGYSN